MTARRRPAVWITRPDEDARPLAAALEAQGIEPRIAPLMSIRFVAGPPLDLSGVQAIAATSANGVRALTSRCARRDIALFAVGDATAQAARAAGFTAVESASGDVAALAELIGRRVDQGGGPVLHVAASVLAGDLAGVLQGMGIRYRREVLYEAETASRLPDDANRWFTNGNLDGVAVFSPRTAATLSKLIVEAGLSHRCADVVACCLSRAVADGLASLPWRSLAVAPHPVQAAMIKAIAAAVAPTE